jgi:hypothetical protein
LSTLNLALSAVLTASVSFSSRVRSTSRAARETRREHEEEEEEEGEEDILDFTKCCTLQIKDKRRKSGRERRVSPQTVQEPLKLVLGRVNDLSESDSSLLEFFAGEREDLNKKSMTRVRVF